MFSKWAISCHQQSAAYAMSGANLPARCSDPKHIYTYVSPTYFSETCFQVSVLRIAVLDFEFFSGCLPPNLPRVVGTKDGSSE